MKIIHLDNSGFFRKVVAQFLTSFRFEVEGFDSWNDAFIAIGGGADMVITGLTLVDAEGPELIEDMVSAYSGPIVVISASVDDELEDTLTSMGVTGAIKKSGNWKQHLIPFLAPLLQKKPPVGARHRP
jgi:DNA-binding NtrC family response regulator